MMAKVIPSRLAVVGSHTVRIEHGRIGDSYGWQITREEAYPRFVTEWRGEPAIVVLTAYRSRYGDGPMTDWQVFGHEARTMNPDGGMFSYGANLTETARHRLAEQNEPAVYAWLAGELEPTGENGETAGPRFAESHARAVTHALAGIARDMRPLVYPGRDLRAAATAMLDAGEITSDENYAWQDLAETFERYTAELERLAP